MPTAHKKHSAFAKTSADKEVKPEGKSAEAKPQAKTEPVVVSDVIAETTEKIEIVEEAVPQAKLETTVINPSPKDPLSSFKEEMNKEELSMPSDAQKKNYMWPILLIFIITSLLLIGVFLYKGGINTTNKINIVALSPTPTVVPEPTKIIDFTKYEIEILNGSGVDGEASRQRTSLEEEGFVVSSVGNADNSDYTDTIIKAKEEVEKAFLDKLKNTLENTFTVGEIETLSDDSSTPVVVIIGTKK